MLLTETRLPEAVVRSILTQLGEDQPFRVVFRKVDDNARVLYARLTGPVSDDGPVVVYDIEKEGTRSFRADSVLSITTEALSIQSR